MSEEWSLKGKKTTMKVCYEMNIRGAPKGFLGYNAKDIETLRKKLIEDIEDMIIKLRHEEHWNEDKLYRDTITEELVGLIERVERRFGNE